MLSYTFVGEENHAIYFYVSSPIRDTQRNLGVGLHDNKRGLHNCFPAKAPSKKNQYLQCNIYENLPLCKAHNK
jgi:hypothetical protein